MTMNEDPSNPRGPEPAGVSAVLATVLAAISWFALAVFGLGILSLVTDRDIISVPGLGQAPGVVGMLAALAVFAGMLWRSLRRQNRTFLATAAFIGLCTALAHLVAVWATVLTSTVDLVVATAVAGDLISGGASAVLFVAGLIAAVGGIALRHSGGRQPKWPWERGDPYEG